MQTIPSLGETAESVLSAALALDCAGFILTFRTVFDGHVRLDDGGFFKADTVRGVPVRGQSVPDSELLALIARGEVSIFVHASDLETFSREYHRATGRAIPLR